MSKEKEDVKKDVILNEYELFCMDFVSKITVVSFTILICIVLILQNLLSYASTNNLSEISLSFNQCSILFLACTAVICSLLILVPLIYQSVIYIVEGLPDKKLKLKRSVNQLIVGLFLIIAVLAMMLVPTIYRLGSASNFKLVFFVIMFLVDGILIYHSICANQKFSFKMFIAISLTTAAVYLLFVKSIPALVSIIIAKIVIIESTYFVRQFKSAYGDDKKNINVLNFTILVSIYTILYYFIFKKDIVEFIQNNNGNMVNYLYGFFYKCVTDNPFGLFKMIKS